MEKNNYSITGWAFVNPSHGFERFGSQHASAQPALAMLEAVLTMLQAIAVAGAPGLTTFSGKGCRDPTLVVCAEKQFNVPSLCPAHIRSRPPVSIIKLPCGSERESFHQADALDACTRQIRGTASEANHTAKRRTFQASQQDVTQNKGRSDVNTCHSMAAFKRQRIFEQPSRSNACVASCQRRLASPCFPGAQSAGTVVSAA